MLLREPRDSDIEDRLRHPVDPEEEDGYGSAWRREWDGRRYHTREHLAAARRPPEPGEYRWAVEHDGHCIGGAGLRVDAGQHRATYTVGLFVAALRGQGLGREITRLVVAWGFGEPRDCTGSSWRCWPSTPAPSAATWPAASASEGVRREAELYPDGWQDLIAMGLLRSEYEPKRSREAAQRTRTRATA